MTSNFMRYCLTRCERPEALTLFQGTLFMMKVLWMICCIQQSSRRSNRNLHSNSVIDGERFTKMFTVRLLFISFAKITLFGSLLLAWSHINGLNQQSSA